MNKRHATQCLGLLLATAWIASAALADTDVWLLNSNGSFNNAANWSVGVPDASDTAIFGRGGAITYTVTFPGNPVFLGTANYSSNILAVGSNTVSFAQSTSPALGDSAYNVTGVVMGGPPAAPSILNTTLTLLSAGTIDVGNGSASPGTLNVNAGALQITGSTGDDELIVGDGGSGSVLSVANGADVNFTGLMGSAVLGKNAGVMGTVNVGGAGSFWNQSGDDVNSLLKVGGFGSGRLNVTGGGVVSDYRGVIAAEVGSNGTAIVNGAGSKWVNREQLIVGLNSAATMTVSGGGEVFDTLSTIGSKPDSAGTVSVTGAGSKWTQVTDLRVGGGGVSINGGSGSGVMIVAAGGYVETRGDGYVSFPGTGTVTIDGAGSLWGVAGNLDVDDDGSVSITDGGKLTSNTAVDAGVVNVSGAGSVWDSADYLSISNIAFFGAAGILNVTAGGHAKGRQVFVGGAGEAHVSGPGSELSSEEQLFVGLSGGGKLRISGGAHVTNGTGQMGVAPNGNAEVSVSGTGSQWISSGDVYVGVAGAAQLTVANGGVASAGGLLTVGAKGIVEGNSTVAAEVRNGGTLAPGQSTGLLPSDSIGTLHVSGDFTQTAAGAFDVQLGSTVIFDKLTISGHATLDGTLHGSLFNGYTPTVGDAVQILTATGGITGRFAALDFPLLTSGSNSPRWFAMYSNTDVILKFVAPLLGDYNRNGVVDAADYVVWRNSLGQSVSHGAGADGSDNGTVDLDDYAVWKTHFGETPGSGAGGYQFLSGENEAVPEPASVVLAVLWLLMGGSATSRATSNGFGRKAAVIV